MQDQTEQQRGKDTGNGNPPPSRGTDTGNGNPPPSKQPVPVEKDPIDKPADEK